MIDMPEKEQLTEKDIFETNIFAEQEEKMIKFASSPDFSESQIPDKKDILGLSREEKKRYILDEKTIFDTNIFNKGNDSIINKPIFPDQKKELDREDIFKFKGKEKAENDFLSNVFKNKVLDWEQDLITENAISDDQVLEKTSTENQDRQENPFKSAGARDE